MLCLSYMMQFGAYLDPSRDTIHLYSVPEHAVKVLLFKLATQKNGR